MARKRREEEHENHERWLVSYADFITLLFAFFVVMYAISSVNEGKYKVLSNSLAPLASRAEALRWCEEAKIDPGVRPETLGPEQFAALQRAREGKDAGAS